MNSKTGFHSGKDRGRKHSLWLLSLLLLVPALTARGQLDTLENRQPAEGVTYLSLRDTTHPWSIHMLKMDLGAFPIQLRSRRALPNHNDRIPDLETLTRMWSRVKDDSLHPVAAVNADFFNMTTGEPVNIQISGGKPVYLPPDPPRRAVFAVSDEGDPFIGLVDYTGWITAGKWTMTLHGLNSRTTHNSITLVNGKSDRPCPQSDSSFVIALKPASDNWSRGTKKFITREQQTGNCSPPFLVATGVMIDSLSILQSAGDTLTIGYRITPMEKPPVETVGGAVHLLENGKNVIDRQIKIERVDSSFVADRHPRTAVGFIPGKSLWLVVVDGRQKSSAGMSLYELADFMAGYGVKEALNLDGGGSSTMIVNGRVVNTPSDRTGIRPVSNALFIIRAEE